MTFGEELIQSANEALAIAKGEAAPARVHVPPKVDVAEIRARQNLSQKAFAERYRLSLGTVRDWEQNRRSPDRAARVLLTLIDKKPGMVLGALEEMDLVS